ASLHHRLYSFGFLQELLARRGELGERLVGLGREIRHQPALAVRHRHGRHAIGEQKNLPRQRGVDRGDLAQGVVARARSTEATSLRRSSIELFTQWLAACPAMITASAARSVFRNNVFFCPS